MEGPSDPSTNSPNNTSPVIIDTTTQNFSEIRKMLGFVDHTHFIHDFLSKDDPLVAIFAPRRFGKTSHMNMLKKFLEITVTPDNKETFKATNIFTNHEYAKTVDEHFGKHPVLHLDFKIRESDSKTTATAISSLETCMAFCREVIHRAYLDHSYLTHSENLDDDSKTYCKNWSDCELHKNENIEMSLKNLTLFLHRHFDQATVFVLIDEFDAVCASAVRTIRGHPRDTTILTIEQICSTLSNLFEPLMSKNRTVGGALITGVSDIANPAYFPFMHNFTRIKFLQGDTFPGFYGATKSELKSIIDRLVDSQSLFHFEDKEELLNANYDLDADKIFMDVQTKYNGYLDKNRSPIFCLWSILQYLQTGEARNFWNEPGEIADICMILKYKEIVYEIINLMKSEKIYFIRQDCNWIEELVDLYDLLKGKSDDDEKERFVDSHIIFNFLLDHGYLGYAPQGKYSRDPLLGRLPGQKFRLPNAEIRTAFSDMVREIVTNFWKIDTTSCTSLIDDITLSVIKNEEVLKTKMLQIHEEISKIIEPLNRQSLHKSNLNEIICIMYKIFNDSNVFEVGPTVTPNARNFLLIHKDDPKFYILWELKYSNSKSKYIWKEAKVNYVKNKKSKIRLLRKLGREALVIATSVDRFRKISLSFSPGMKEKIFSISEKSHCMYPNLYKMRFGKKKK